MSNFQSLLAALAAMAQKQSPDEKPIDYEHPLVEGEPIPPCCELMSVVDVTPNHCICPDKKHQGAIFHSRNCTCPDRFMPMADMTNPPEIKYAGKLSSTVHFMLGEHNDEEMAVEMHKYVNRFESLN